jgi:hypothetical protein
VSNMTVAQLGVLIALDVLVFSLKLLAWCAL